MIEQKEVIAKNRKSACPPRHPLNPPLHATVVSESSI